MDFIINIFATLLPLLITLIFSMRTASLIVEPTSYLSFFGLFWFPYHDQLPARILYDALIVGFIDAILHLLSPRFPRLLKAYSKSASPTLPLNAKALLPENEWWTVGFFTLGIAGWLGSWMGMSVGYKYLMGLCMYCLGGGVILMVGLQILRVVWLYVRYFPERPPLGIVTGMLWPPMHPVKKFGARVGNRVRLLFGGEAATVQPEELIQAARYLAYIRRELGQAATVQPVELAQAARYLADIQRELGQVA